jgi:hypothetical protein
MVAGLGDEEETLNLGKAPEPKNRVIRVMIRRLGTCKTFGENMIFMLNRASEYGLYNCQAMVLILN